MYSSKSRNRKITWATPKRKQPSWEEALVIILAMVIVVLILLGAEIRQEDQYILELRAKESICQIHYATEGHSLVSYRRC